MDWNLALTVIVQVAVLAAASGTVLTRVKYLEKEYEELKKELSDFREMKEDLAVMRNELKNIGSCLNRLVNIVDKRIADEVHSSGAYSGHSLGA